MKVVFQTFLKYKFIAEFFGDFVTATISYKHNTYLIQLVVRKTRDLESK
jgi:hypothetical protein